MINIIFLDIDGVLNDGDYIEKCYEMHHQPMFMENVPFNPRSLKNLRLIWQSILDNGDEPMIVLSSTWRMGDIPKAIVESRLAEYGMYFKDVTPYINQNRGLEIINWLETNNYLYNPFVILDDDIFDIKDKPKLISHLVQTSFKRGLLGFKAKQAIKILNKKKGLNEKIE